MTNQPQPGEVWFYNEDPVIVTSVDCSNHRHIWGNSQDGTGKYHIDDLSPAVVLPAPPEAGSVGFRCMCRLCIDHEAGL